MNKVISIHLRGVAFQLEESGYDSLRAYLEKAERQLASNPDRAEILADIEQAISEKFRALLATGRNVILSSEVDTVIKEMGPVTDGTEASDAASAGTTPKMESASKSESKEAPRPRRLYRLKEGAMLAGVCNGLASYLGVDVTLIRLIVAVMVFVSFGTVAIAYLLAVLIIPRADTPEEKAAAARPVPTAQEFIRMAKEGYYEGVKSIPDREARREWKKKFKREMREWRRSFRNEFNWSPPWTHPCATPPTPPPPSPGYQVMLPILFTLKGLLAFFTLIAVISLIATGTVFGISLPGHLPVWAGVVIVIVAYKLTVSPIKALRRQLYYQTNGWHTCWNPFTEVAQTLLGIFVFVFCVFIADKLVPGFHQVLLDFRDFLHHVFASLNQWWTNKGTP